MNPHPPQPEPRRAGVPAGHPLGDYLRARRDQVTPQQAGIPGAGPRRVPGLRREEVAMLAGISADYYLRLERGRDRHPSTQVLEALARALRLDDAHRAHLEALAADGSLRRPRLEAQEPQSGVLQLLGTLSQPAYIEGRGFDILASNPLARTLSPQFIVGRNLLRDLVLDPRVQSLHPQWEANAECLVADLRQAMVPGTEHADLVALVEELASTSEVFRRLWARHEVRGQSGGPIRMRHPEVGDLTLERERLSIDGADGQSLVIFHADPGTADAAALARLTSRHPADLAVSG